MMLKMPFEHQCDAVDFVGGIAGCAASRLRLWPRLTIGKLLANCCFALLGRCFASGRGWFRAPGIRSARCAYGALCEGTA